MTRRTDFPLEACTDMKASNRVVFDLGMNNGDDTDYYLFCGHPVVAVEANPDLCAAASVRFADQIGEGKLVILNRAISNSADERVFYINTSNHHWSSLDANWASRNSTAFRECRALGITIASLFEQFGCPYYLKIDIEGADGMVLEQLADMARIPEFISIEDCRFGFDYIERLHAIGYRQFAISNQASVPASMDRQNGYEFASGSSGAFGDRLDAEWLSHAEFVEFYGRTVRDRATLKKISPTPDEIWWDIHGRS